MGKKKLPTYELEVGDMNDPMSSVTFVALVDEPAIERNWMAFQKEYFVDPQAGESESDFMGRCISKLKDEGKEQDQAVAICISKWEGRKEQQFNFKIQNEERRIITGPLMIADMAIPRYDEKTGES